MSDYLERRQSLLWSAILGHHRHDNHGNVQHGQQITCADGLVIDYPRDQRAADASSIDIVTGLAGLLDDMDDRRMSLGELESPLQTRCQRAVEAREL